MDEDFNYNNGTPTEQCLIVPQKNSSIILDTHLYGGIPETLILNVIAWILFIMLFTVSNLFNITANIKIAKLCC